jgi:hypothetical protein
MPDQSRITRRTFFAGLGLAAAAGVAAKLSSKPSLPQTAEPEPTAPPGGYQLTEHIKKYYRTTTI